jgi:hypothetical protein
MPSSLKLIALLAGLAVGASAAAPNFKLPPLNQPASTASHPGQFIWADLFTADVAASTKFYGELFGWEWKTFGSGPSAYSLASVGGEPVAGAVLRPRVKGETAGAHWIGYIAVPDIASAAQKATAAGGRVVLAPRPVPDRGQLAIVADNEGTLLGLLQSSSGDPEEHDAKAGTWSWAQLFAGDVAHAKTFYPAVFGYTVEAASHAQLADSIYLFSGGVARAGVARMPADRQAKPVWLGFVRVTDVAATVARAKALGGNVVGETRTTPDGAVVAVITDPAGAPIGLVSDTPSTQEAK